VVGEDTGGSEPVFGSVDLDAVLDAWPECARVLSLSGEIIHVNPAGLAILEMELDQARGRAWPLLWPPEARGPLQDAIAAAAGGRTGSFRAMCLSHRGKRLWLDTVVSPVRDRSGKVVQLLAVSRDVSGLMESEAFLDTLVRLLPNPILAKRARDGCYVLINQAAEAAFGLSSADAVGKSAYELFPYEEAPGLRRGGRRGRRLAADAGLRRRSRSPPATGCAISRPRNSPPTTATSRCTW
jgi:PAS domain S-box-containing protein